MNAPITLKELFAMIIRRGRCALILLLLFAALFGGCRAGSLYRKYGPSGQYAQIVDSQEEESDGHLYIDYYKMQASYFQAQIDNQYETQKKLMEYSNDSLLMKIDPYNKGVSTVLLTVTDYGTPKRTDSSLGGVSSEDYIIGRIEQLYAFYFLGTDLQNNLPGYPNAEAEDKYLKELVNIDFEYGGILRVTAVGRTQEEAELLANAVVQVLTDANHEIAESSVPHRLSVISWTTNSTIDDKLNKSHQAIDKSIQEGEEKLQDLNTQLMRINDQIETLKKGDPISGQTISTRSLIRSSIKYAAVGAAFGLFLDVVLVILLFIFGNRLEFSSQIGKAFSIPCLISTAQNRKIWSRLADRLLGEQNWSSEDEAETYLRQISGALLRGMGSVAVLSSLPLQANEQPVRSIVNALSNGDRKILFVDTAAKNADTAAAVAECDCVLLAERLYKSKITDINAVSGLVQSIGKPIAGYVML